MSDIPAAFSNEILKYLNQREDTNVTDLTNHLNSKFEFDNPTEIHERIIQYLHLLNEVKMGNLKDDETFKFFKMTPIKKVEVKNCQMKVQHASTNEVQPAIVASTSRKSKKPAAKEPGTRQHNVAARSCSNKNSKALTVRSSTKRQIEDEVKIPTPIKTIKITPKKPGNTWWPCTIM